MSQLGDLPQWLTNEAISNYIVFIAGALLTSVIWLLGIRLKKRKPSIVLVEKLLDIEVLSTDDEIGERLKIEYREQPITELHEAAFRIRNIGSEPIEDVAITFHIEGLASMSFLEMHVATREETQEILTLPTDAQELQPLTIGAPFLNPWKVYEDYVGVTIYAPRAISVEDVTGKGLGWTTRYVDKAEYVSQLTELLTRTAPSVFVVALKLADLVNRFKRQ